MTRTVWTRWRINKKSHFNNLEIVFPFWSGSFLKDKKNKLNILAMASTISKTSFLFWKFFKNYKIEVIRRFQNWEAKPEEWLGILFTTLEQS